MLLREYEDVGRRARSLSRGEEYALNKCINIFSGRGGSSLGPLGTNSVSLDIVMKS